MTITTTLTSKGQVTIPKELREKLDLQKGDKLVLVEEDDNIILRKMSLEEVRKEALEKYKSGQFVNHEETFSDRE